MKRIARDRQKKRQFTNLRSGGLDCVQRMRLRVYGTKGSSGTCETNGAYEFWGSCVNSKLVLLVTKKRELNHCRYSTNTEKDI